MRKQTLPLAAALLFASSCSHTAPVAPPPTVQAEAKPVPAEQLVDHEGDSMTTAVPMPGNAPNDGIDFENEWIYAHYHRFRRVSTAIGNALGRRYEVIKVEFPDGSTKTVFFDITENWNNWKPTPK